MLPLRSLAPDSRIHGVTTVTARLPVRPRLPLSGYFTCGERFSVATSGMLAAASSSVKATVAL